MAMKTSEKTSRGKFGDRRMECTPKRVGWFDTNRAYGSSRGKDVTSDLAVSAVTFLQDVRMDAPGNHGVDLDREKRVHSRFVG